MNAENNSVEKIFESVEKIFEITPGGMKILKESFICLDDLTEVLGRLSLLRSRLNTIKTENAWVHCSVNDDWELKISICVSIFCNNKYSVRLGGMIDLDIQKETPDLEVDEILKKIFEILRAPKLKDAVLSAYLTQKNGVFIEEDKK